MSKKSAREIELEKQLQAALKMVADRDKKIIDQQKEIESLKKTIAKQNKELEEKALEIKRKNDIILLNNYNQYFSKSVLFAEIFGLQFFKLFRKSTRLHNGLRCCF